MFSGITLFPVLPQQNPNEGRVIINDNFEKINAAFETIEISSSTGATIVTSGDNIEVVFGGYSGLTTPIYIVNTLQDVSFNAISGATIFSGSTNLNDLLYGSSGDFLPISGGTLTGPVQGVFNGNGSGLSGITFTDIYTTGATFNPISALATFRRNDGNVYTLSLSGLTGGTFGDIYTTGATFDSNTSIATFNRNDGNSYMLDLSTITGGTSGGTISGDYLPLSGGTVTGGTIFTSGLSANTAFNYSDGSQQLGRVLTSDANGNASWQVQAVGTSLTYFFNNSLADVSPYFQAKTDVQTQALETITNLNVVNNQLLAGFITDAGQPELTFIPGGIVSLHIHAANTNSGKATELYFELYKRTTGGTETLLGQSNLTPTLGALQSGYETELSITATTLNVTDRFVTKVYARVTGGGSAPNIDLYLADGTLSRVQIPTPILNFTNYVPYSGATGDVNLGIHGLVATTISATTYQGLPIDIRVTGGTFNQSNRTATFTNNTGGTFTVTGFTDTFVTGGTYNNTTGTATFANNTGGTFNVTGFTTGATGSSSLVVSSTAISGGQTDNILFQSGSTLLQSNAFKYIASSNTLNLSAATANLNFRTPNNSLHIFDTGSPSSGYYIGSSPTASGLNKFLLISPGAVQLFDTSTGSRTTFSWAFSTGNIDIGNFGNRLRVTSSAWATNWEVGGRDGNWGLNSTGTQPANTTRGVFWQEIGVAPVANITDAFQQYAADATTGGTASPHFRTENGNIIKLYQQNTGTTAASFSANSSGIANDTATYDGYTMGQIVRALRNAGFLA